MQVSIFNAILLYMLCMHAFLKSKKQKTKNKRTKTKNKKTKIKSQK
jgi:hypothetical protein